MTGLGILTAAGEGVAANTEALREGRSGLGALSLFDSPVCGKFPVGQVAGVSEAPRTAALAKRALREALVGVDPSRAGLAVGVTVGGMPESEKLLAELLASGEIRDPEAFSRHDLGWVTTHLAREFGLRGPRLTISNACASGAEAIACAAELLLDGEADIMVAGGVDALCRITLNGFASLLAMDELGCRPFDVTREGMSLGEGAAWIVLQRLEDAPEPIAILAGWGNSCDAHHATAPDPDGRGAEAAIRQALRGDLAVDYINAHGTGTRDNDRAESAALRRIFGDSLPPISSTKRVFGHTLGASGAIEAVVSALCIREGFLPANPGFDSLDPECGVTPILERIDTRPQRVLSNSFGFGGNNSVLCFRAPS